jgi:hypothetical protein
MNPQTQELIKTERRLADCFFTKETIQGGKVRQSTYIHEIEMSYDLYFQLKDRKIINHNSLARFSSKRNGERIWDPIAFFEFKNDKVIISFSHIYNREDFRAMIDRYLIIEAYGEYPLKINWVSKMNFDPKPKELVTNESPESNRFNTVGKKGNNRRY